MILSKTSSGFLKSPFCIAVIAFASSMVWSGCLSVPTDPTVWKREIRSPDAAWIATAKTDQWGGFGSAWVETTVSLRKVDGTVNHGKSFDVLSYPGGGPIPKTYVLSDENADKDLQIVWLTPKHLRITHHSRVDPDLAVVKLAAIDISFR